MTRLEKAKEVRNWLKRVAREGSQVWSINDQRIVLALERLVARLMADSKLNDRLVFKGGFVLYKVLGHPRFTRDLDALGRNVSLSATKRLVSKALVRDLKDGFWFGDVNVENLDEQGEFGALRFNCAFQIGDPPTDKAKIKKLSRVHVDIGFGDALPETLEPKILRSLLPNEQPISWSVYPTEYIVAEKLQTLVARGAANSRARDVFDILWLLDGIKHKEALVAAIKKCFATRSTELPKSFKRFCGRLETTVLERAWKSLQVSCPLPIFLNAWSELKQKLGSLDAYLQQK